MNKNDFPFSLPAASLAATLITMVEKKTPQPSKRSRKWQLHDDIRQICRHNRDGGDKKQRERQRTLLLCADQLCQHSRCGLKAINLKPKHIEKLVGRWISEGLRFATIRNRLTALRWLARKLGKPHLVARSNHAYGIEDRSKKDR